MDDHASLVLYLSYEKERKRPKNVADILWLKFCVM